MSSKNSQCETFVPMLDAFVDNELEQSEKEQVQTHVQSCEYCKHQVKAIESLKASLASMPRRKMSLDLADNFDQILKKGPEDTAQKPSNVVPFAAKRRWLVAAASAAAVAVIAIAGSIVSKGGDHQVANSNASNRFPSLAQHSGSAGQVVKNGMNTGDKIGFVKNQSESADLANGNVRDSQVAKSTDINSQSELKIATAQPKKGTVKEDGPDEAVAKTAGAHLHENVSQNQSSNTTVVAHDLSSKTSTGSMQNNRSSGSELLALYEEDDGIGSDIGMTTDEDGLYAIKL